MPLEHQAIVLGEQAGLLWTWWKGDPLPILPPLATFKVAEIRSSQQLVTLMDTPEEQLAAILQEGHHAYIAYLSATPVAYGWSASNRASFGEGRVKFLVPAKDRYLYNFVTLPSWRGMGIYPRLLQTILKRESGTVSEDDLPNSESSSNQLAERFWINHHSANTASARGIARAGFHIASNVYFNGDDRLVLLSSAEESERAQAGAELLNLPLIKKQG